jgi:hypothetical protein
MSGPQRHIEYQPPSPEVLEHFVRDFYREYCPQQMAGEDALAFTGFLKAVARALANSLNRKGNDPVDNGVE